MTICGISLLSTLIMIIVVHLTKFQLEAQCLFLLIDVNNKQSEKVPFGAKNEVNGINKMSSSYIL